MDTNLYRKLQVLILILGLGVSAAFAAPELTYEEFTTVADDHVVITWVTSNEVSNTGIEYGVVLPTTPYVTDEGVSRKNYHYLTLSDLYPNTRYVYRIFSENSSGEKTYGEVKTFKTLEPPSGQLLFTFASISDPQVTQNYQDTYGARGRPYTTSEAIFNSAINQVLAFSPSFTLLKGDLIDDRSTDKNDDATRVKNAVISILDPVFPIPGNHDKDAFPARAWYTTLLQPIFDPLTYTPPAEFTDFEKDSDLATGEDSVYNYSFNYRGYHFVFLDSVRANIKGHVDTTWLANDLAANTDKKSFIFMHYVITNEAIQIPEEVIKEVTGGSTDMEKIDLDNRSDFLDVLDTYKSEIVGVFMGHIHDNYRYYRSGFDFPFVRTAATIQFPIGFNIYKVYSNGYMQLFYKVPYYTEVGRDHITPEAGYSDTYWEQFSLGSEYSRNFVTTFSEVQIPPTVKNNAPSDNSTNVALNQPVIITFTKQMSTETTQNAITIAPDVSAKSSSWSNSDTTLTISHSGFSASTAYTVTVGDAARSQDNIQIAAPFSFSFTSGTTSATAPPEAVVDEITNDITSDPTPTFTGIATDENSTISNVEYRISRPSWSEWKASTPLDGAFDSNQETFTFTVTPEVTRGEHEIQIRCTNAAGVSTQTDFTSYTFSYVGTRPEIILKADGTEIINGDPIKSNPSFEVTVVTDKGLNLSNLTFYLNQTAINTTTASQENNTTRTYAYYNPTLSDGTQDVRIEAVDNEGNVSTREAVSLLVQTTGDVRIFGVPLNYPNPFDPGTQSTTISYVLSKASNVELNIFDLAGNLLLKQSYSSGQDGGKAGYNEVTWDGKANGNYVGNGIYLYLIVADGRVPQNGKGKLTVFKQ